MKVVIIGGGVAGLAIGWRLLRSGAEVILFDRAQPGQGATWASAGMLELGLARAPSNVRPETELGRRSAALWPEFAREIENVSGMSVGWRQDGALLVAQDGERAAALQKAGREIEGAEWLDVVAARAQEPLLTLNISGALHFQNEAQVDNRRLGVALARAFSRSGGKLNANEAVIRLEIVNDHAVAVRTPFASYDADAFVLAAGAWSAQLGGLPLAVVPPVRPVKGEMIALQPSDPGMLPRRLIWSNDIYLVPRGERLFVGATLEEAGFDTSLTSAARHWLQEKAIALLPASAAWPVVEHWAGLRPGSVDGLPILGKSALEGLFVATGQFRNGILFAPAIAEALDRAVMGREPSHWMEAFSPLRF